MCVQDSGGGEDAGVVPDETARTEKTSGAGPPAALRHDKNPS